jgi:hypothetical protein
MSDLPATFDYTLLDPPAASTARAAASKIKLHGKVVAQNIVAIGAELANVKAAIGHGHYLPWLSAELGLSERQAQRFVAVYENFGKSDNVSDLGAVDVSALYLLAAPSTPEPVREAALSKAAAGERVTHRVVKNLLHEERDQADRAVDPRPLAFSGTGAEPSAQEVETEQTGTESEEKEQEEIDDTKFILEHVAAAYELVRYYMACKPQQIAGFIDPARRSAALVKKTKRLENWFHELGYWLEQGR